jgi:hypothetical protein
MSADHHSPPPPPEPQTPTWLTVVGCVLLFLVGTWVVTVPAGAPKSGDAAAAPAASAAASAAPSASAAH